MRSILIVVIALTVLTSAGWIFYKHEQKVRLLEAWDAQYQNTWDAFKMADANVDRIEPIFQSFYKKYQDSDTTLAGMPLPKEEWQARMKKEEGLTICGGDLQMYRLYVKLLQLAESGGSVSTVLSVRKVVIDEQNSLASCSMTGNDGQPL